jgi:hypothetical protein
MSLQSDVTQGTKEKKSTQSYTIYRYRNQVDKTTEK